MFLLPSILGCLFMIEAIGGGAAEDLDEKEYSIDAWRTLTQIGADEYRLMYCSSQFDGRLRGVAKYVSLNSREYNETLRTAKIRFMYGDPGSSFLVTVTQRATAQPSPKNETNIIRFSNADLCNQGTDNLTAEYEVLYSNYETCFVLKFLSTEEKRCELWVKEGFEVHFENEPDEEDSDDEEDKVDGEDNVESRIQRLRKGGLGHCVQTYTENCGSMQYKIYEKEMCSLSSLAKEANGQTKF
uniref:Putative salivary lipocalin n=1 Tax=Ixodes ricinus TaxID=34613 RepID=A0A0K8RGD1_IXORI